MTHDDGLRQFVEDELEYLWYLLGEADDRWRDAPWYKPESWSGACEGLAIRIQHATTLVGPISWRKVGMSRIANGWFDWANEKMGLKNPVPPDGIAYCLEYVSGQLLI